MSRRRLPLVFWGTRRSRIRLSLFLADYPSTSGFDEPSDSNKDGVVDATDFQNLFINVFNTFVAPPGPPPVAPPSGMLQGGGNGSLEVEILGTQIVSIDSGDGLAGTYSGSKHVRSIVADTPLPLSQPNAPPSETDEAIEDEIEQLVSIDESLTSTKKFVVSSDGKVADQAIEAVDVEIQPRERSTDEEATDTAVAELGAARDKVFAELA